MSRPRFPDILKRKDLDTVYQFKWFMIYFWTPIILLVIHEYFFT